MTHSIEILQWKEDGALRAVQAGPGVFRIEFAQGLPYIGKTANLRRRLLRLLRPRDAPSVRITLRETASGVHYCRTGSAFESDLLLYRAAKRFRPEDYRAYLKLRPPAFVKLLLRNRFPRTCLTQHLARSKALYYGPFPNRNAAEQFQAAFLDLFRVRRCTQNLHPSPDHPGCIWGELQLCLRPCQAACDNEQYAAEVDRMKRFLSTDGESLLQEAEAARDRASAAMEFESAARHHRLLAKTKEALRLRGELSREVGMQHGMVLQRSAKEAFLELTPLYKGSLQESIRVGWGGGEPSTAAVGALLRDALADRDWIEAPPAENEEHLALLQRWHASSFRQGEFVPFPDMAKPPIRKLAHSAQRVASRRERGPARAAEPPPPIRAGSAIVALRTRNLGGEASRRPT